MLIVVNQIFLLKMDDSTVFSLIKEMEQHPCLWKKSDKDFKNSFKINDSFKEIAAIMDLDENAVKDKIKSLRTIFFQNVQKAKKGKSGSGGGAQPKWKFYNALSFLQGEAADCGAIDSMALNTTVLNWIYNCDIANSHHRMFSSRCSQATDEVPTNEDLSLESQLIERPISSLSQHSTALSQASSTASGAVTPIGSGKKRKVANDNGRQACWAALMESLQPKNANEEFGNYVSTTLSQIKDNNLLQRTKCQIQIILSKALAESAEQQLAANVQQIVVFDSEGRIIADANELIEEEN